MSYKFRGWLLQQFEKIYLIYILAHETHMWVIFPSLVLSYISLPLLPWLGKAWHKEEAAHPRLSMGIGGLPNNSTWVGVAMSKTHILTWGVTPSPHPPMTRDGRGDMPMCERKEEEWEKKNWFLSFLWGRQGVYFVRLKNNFEERNCKRIWWSSSFTTNNLLYCL